MSNKLTFADDRKSVQVVFADGKETDFLTSKYEAMEAFTNLLRDERITRDEHVDFQHQTLDEENLPWAEEEEHGPMDFLELFSGMGGPHGYVIDLDLGRGGISVSRIGRHPLADIFGLADIIGGGARKKASRKSEGSEKTGTRLEVCPNCGKHACIILADGNKSGNFITQESGMKCVAELKTEGKINDAEEIQLTEEINACNLPEDFGEMMFDMHPLGMLAKILSRSGKNNLSGYDITPTKKPELRFNEQKTAGRVFVGEYHSNEFNNKEDGARILSHGKELMNKTHYSRLEKEIANSELPATAAEAKEKKEAVS